MRKLTKIRQGQSAEFDTVCKQKNEGFLKLLDMMEFAEKLVSGRMHLEDSEITNAIRAKVTAVVKTFYPDADRRMVEDSIKNLTRYTANIIHRALGY